MRAHTISNRPSSRQKTYQSRQTKSSQSPSPRRLVPNEVLASSPHLSQDQRASIRSTHQISFSLVSLVTKFEALDALSMHFKVPSLQPAPLQVSPRPKRRGGGGATGHFRKLSTIFSPSRSGENDDPFFSKEDPVTGRQNLINSRNNKTTFSTLTSKFDTKKLRKVQTKSNDGSICTRRSINKNINGTPGSSVTAPYVKNELPTKNRRSIRDMVRLYDGAASDGILTRRKPSTIGSRTPTTPTPISRKRPSENRYHHSPWTGNPRQGLQSRYSKNLDSRTRSCQSVSGRSQILQQSKANSVISKNSLSKSSINSLHVSPRTIDRDRDPQEVRNVGAASSPIRNGKYQKVDQELLPSTEKGMKSPAADRGRSIHSKNMPATIDRRQLNDKIEMLYRAKSLERKQDSDQARNSKVPLSTKETGHQNIGNASPESDFGRYLRKKSSKVAAMTKLFDKGTAPKPSVGVAPTPRQKPVFAAVSPFMEQETSPKARVPPQPHSRARKSTISPKTIQEALITDANNVSPSKASCSTMQSNISQKRPSKPKGRSINEKVQLFESARSSKEIVLAVKRNTFARKLSRSLKGLFEPHTSRRSENKSQAGQDRELSGIEVKAIIDKVQDENKSVRIGKRKCTAVGRWDTITAAPAANGCDGALSEKAIGSPSTAEVQQMVVKEAECGLKEPKPVRVAEVKRMMLICKERFGDMMDKEKVHVKKF